jgi:hypothetical protein
MVFILVELVVHHGKLMVQKIHGCPSLARVFLKAALYKVFKLWGNGLNMVQVGGFLFSHVFV